MKETYVSPEVEIVEFETEDIMNASNIIYKPDIEGWDDGWGSTGDF